MKKKQELNKTKTMKKQTQKKKQSAAPLLLGICI